MVKLVWCHEGRIPLPYVRCVSCVLNKDLGALLFRLFVILPMVYHTGSTMLCPVPTPCHCIGDDIIYCAYQRLQGLPYFMDFFEIWDKLNLSDNLISSIPADGFKAVKIRTLDLSRNLISDLDPNTFRAIENLQCLDMSHNKLKMLSEVVFTPLDDLLTLRIRYNRLRVIKPGTFSNLAGVVELDLTGNELSKVPTEALEPMKNLRRLWLRNNRLKAIEPHAFPELPIEVLDLGDNASPMRMSSEALCGLRPSISHKKHSVKEWSGLHTLLMDHNGISHLDACVVKLAWTLQKIDISGNPLRCDCRLYFLKLWGTRTSFPMAQCAEPYRYAGELFDMLGTHAFNCSQRDISDNCENLCYVEQLITTDSAAKVSNLCFSFNVFVNIFLIFWCCLTKYLC